MFKVMKTPTGKYAVCERLKGIMCYSYGVVKTFEKKDSAKKYLLELEKNVKNGKNKRKVHL